MQKKLQQLSLALASTLPVFLSQPASAGSQDAPTQTCKALPDDQKPQNGKSSDNSRLGDCKGVLHPPAVGDPELVKPAPDVGTMPVIPPGSVPPNGGNGSEGQGGTK